ncbi:MAG: hypothetical protein ACFFEY_13320 [Candidatus Thorarchaeota archaeon]
MQNSEELAQEALKFLEIAQSFEKNHNIEEAIYNYQKAADFLKQSGFLMHRIQEIYDRVGELKDLRQRETLYQKTQQKAQIEQLQDQAFELLEAAKNLEFEGYFEDAIKQYLSTINLLTNAGWSETQIENLKLKINELVQNLKQQKAKQKQREEIKIKQEESSLVTDEKTQVVGMFGQKSSIEKAEIVKTYQQKKKKEKEVQEEAFAHIDAAKMFEKEKKFDTAIKNYERAIELLNSIGWNIQTQKIQTIIEKLKKDKTEFEGVSTEQRSISLDDIEEQNIRLEKEVELRKQKLIEFETKKNYEEEIQQKAFNLIDIGNKLEREKKYDIAIDKLNKAVELLKSIEWDSYIQPISRLIEGIKEKQKKENLDYQIKEKREKNLLSLQNSIYRKSKVLGSESLEEITRKKKDYEERKKEDLKRENELLKILDKADEILKRKNFDEAINEYQKALSFLSNLDQSWQSYKSLIKNTIFNVEHLKNSHFTKEYEKQKKIEERRREELDFQKSIITQISKERELLKKKEIKVRDREDQLIYFNQRKNVAFEFLDSAVENLKKGNYDNTILNYQNTANIFAEIQWLDEVQIIEDSIRDVEELRREKNIQKQKELQDTIERKKKDEEFQRQISKYLQQEREELKKKKIELMEREKELKYREERRIAGFKLLEEAQINVKKGNFDRGIELLQHAITFFAEANWKDEIALIQNSIFKIENRKRERELAKQIKFQADLEREKQEREFQERIKIELTSQKQKLNEKEIILRERESELAYRETKKQEAFKLLEKAQEFLSHRKFDETLQLYYNVSNIFAQIQWNEEIPVIQEAILNIESKKKEDQLNELTLLQKAIKKEAEEKAFIQRIKYQTEREKADLLKEKEFLEIQKELSAQNLVKQQKVFNLIEKGNKILDEEKFDEVIDNYNEAIALLKEIGWEKRYLTLLDDTINTIKNKKREKEIEKQKEFELLLKRQKEDELLQNKISEYMSKEHERLKKKKIELVKTEDLMHLMQQRKVEAFTIMDDAQNLLNQGEYEKSIQKYHDAELILNEINFPTGAIREMISKIQEKNREENLSRIKDMEFKIKHEKEEELFQNQLLEKIKFEEQKMREKQEIIKRQEELKTLEEQKRENAFNILEDAQEEIKKRNYDEAIKLYHAVEGIFKEIQWNEEILLIQNSIISVENKKRDEEIKKQEEFQAALEKEKQERIFQESLIKEMKLQREELKKKEIKLREIEKEESYREIRKEEAFKLLEQAQNKINLGELDDVIECYHNVANIFAQIQWNNEIPIINKAIQDIELKKRDKELIKEKILSEAIEKEKENYEFMEKVRILRETERLRAIKEKESIQERKLISVQNLEKEEKAFKYIDKGYDLLLKKNFDEALDNYQLAINLLTEIGWASDYLKLIKDNVKLIEARKRELDIEREKENDFLIQHKKEEQEFQKKIYDYMQKEQDRLKAKKIEIQKKEDLKQIKELRKKEAFEILNAAEKAFNQNLNDQAIDRYRKAELILNEIEFPTNSIKEMIHKIQNKKYENQIQKQKKLEIQLQQAQQQYKFQQKLSENLKINEIKLKAKKIEIEKQKEYKSYIEKKRQEAFYLLDDAEVHMKELHYDKALEYYHVAESILNEIGYPTNTIRELILKVQDKKRESQLQKQKKLEINQKREREEWEIHLRIAENLKMEQERLRKKKLKIQEKEELKSKLEQRRQQAFKILDEGENFLKDQKYDNALVCYRRAGIILNEIHFPTDYINNMILKIENLKKEKEESSILQYQKELEKLEEEKALSALIEERKRQEREKKEAQMLALQEREKIIEKQRNVRESAYSLLDQGGKYLKIQPPNYNEAISLYIQARQILAENIGWEPEIRNLDVLIKELQHEQASFIEKKRFDEQKRLQRQKEYAIFEEEVRQRRLEQEKLKREKEKHYRELLLKRQHADQLRNDGLHLIDEGKKWARYHDFERAYKSFNLAISKFKDIGWAEEIRYIETEIKNTEKIEERVKNEEKKIKEIQKQLEEQKDIEEQRRKKDETELKKTVGEVGEIANDLMKMIEERRKEQEFIKKQEKAKIQTKAKEFRSALSNLIKVKQELKDEIAKREDKKRIFEEKLEESKDREKVENIKKMIKAAAEKKKK